MLQAGWFFFFWNLATLVSPDFLFVHGQPLVDLAIVGTTILCLLLPARKAWPLFLISQIVIPIYFMPLIGNNVTVRAIVVFFLFLDWLWISVRNSRAFSILTIIKADAPSLRAILLLVYLIAGIHKLNVDFTRPDASCVRAVLEQSLTYFPNSQNAFIHHGLVELGIYLTLTLELLFPFFLFYRLSRPWVLAVLIGFHTFLGLNYLDFSLTQFGFLCLFIPEPTLAQWTRRIRSFTPKSLATWCLMILIASFYHFIPWLRPYVWSVRPFELFPTLFIICALCTGVRVGLFRDFFKEPQKTASRRSGTFLWAAWIILVCLGLAPYYGLRTFATLSMFSNLRVQNGNNHYFLPSIPVFSDSERLIEIYSTNNKFLYKTYIQGAQILTKIDLERFMFIASHRGISANVSYRDAERGKSSVAGIDSNASREIEDFRRRPFWQKKLMAFRPIPKGDITACQW